MSGKLTTKSCCMKRFTSARGIHWISLFAELVLIFQWFNPFAWLYRKELENNLEFLTDDQLVQTAGRGEGKLPDEPFESIRTAFPA